MLAMCPSTGMDAVQVGNSKTSDQVLEWTWRGKLRDQENQKSVNQLHYKVT